MINESYIGVSDRIYFDTINNLMHLLICIKDPTEKEKKSIRKGKIDIRLFVPEKKILFVLIKFDCGMEFDSPYNSYLYKLIGGNIHPEKFGNMLRITLINTKNGKIEFERIIGLAENFASRISKIAKEQLNFPISKNEYIGIIEKYYLKFSIKEMIIKSADIFILEPDGNCFSSVQLDKNEEKELYHEISDDLQKFYCYVADAGKCLKTIPYQFMEEAKGNPEGYQIPLPVKYVLSAKHEIISNYLYCEIEYNNKIGAILPEGNWEEW